MVRELRPYIVTSWHGHRDDPAVPAAVRTVWAEKFKRGRPGRPQFQRGTQSNVDLALLDVEGGVIRSFDAFRPAGRKRGESLASYTAYELKIASAVLGVEADGSAGRPTFELPDLGDGKGSGVRVFVRLLDDRMVAYRAPVVEVVPLTGEDWSRLAYPESERSVEARTLKKWLRQVFPPGVMERTDQRTKKVYQIAATEGSLTLKPAGSAGGRRYAILSGTVKFTDEGADGFSYQGKLEVVLSYPDGVAGPPALRGVFEGTYPRFDRRYRRTRNLALQAVFESRPE